MHDLAHSQESDRLADIVVVDQAQDVVVGGAAFCSAAISSIRSVMMSPLDWNSHVLVS